MAMRITSLRCRRSGGAIVEFALILPFFLLFVFAVLELVRALYVVNILQEVTRRAASSAAVADFTNSATMSAIGRSAVFDAVGGRLPLGAPVTDAHVRIDYLSITRDASGVMTYASMPAASLPASPARNHVNCVQNPYAGDCIRLVRARICDPANSAECVAVRYQSAFPLINMSFSLSRSVTLLPAENLGWQPGDTP